MEIQKCSEVLKQAGYRRAVDQRGQVRIEVDTAVVSRLRGQSGSPSVACIGLQLGQFLEALGIAQVREGVVPENAAWEADQNRSQGGQAFPVRGISDRRSGGVKGTFPPNS